MGSNLVHVQSLDHVLGVLFDGTQDLGHRCNDELHGAVVQHLRTRLSNPQVRKWLSPFTTEFRERTSIHQEILEKEERITLYSHTV